ncbi:MAG: DNA cytosine methyltransferase [Gemmataceae bacterium]|nr:DNA cytosine methyltransferase [Gemmataceae bacterium]
MSDTNQFTFIDVFAGCGGLSLGLMQARWKGLFAIEADRFAFETLKHNLLGDGPCRYDWPSWLPQERREISGFLRTYKKELEPLVGKIDLIAGGPPCQGFSFAGRRDKDDPRNGLFKHYLEVVALLRPPLLFFENVRGVTIEFGKKHRPRKRGPGRPPTPFSVKIQDKLTDLGYAVFPLLVRAMDCGVPQFRPRYIMIAIDGKLLESRAGYNPYSRLEEIRKVFLAEKNLPLDKPVGVREAISDLETVGKELVACPDVKGGYEQIVYGKPGTTYQVLLHGSMNGTSPNSLRLAKHRDEIRTRFAAILATCRRGIQMNPADRQRFGLKKKCVVPLDPEQPSHTLTSLPDDLIHYSEPRILTVRECARLQSFPDWYAFKGKYTTGGSKRVRECPRYTQVANAVPPFLAEVLGRLLESVAEELLPCRTNASQPARGCRNR